MSIEVHDVIRADQIELEDKILILNEEGAEDPIEVYFKMEENGAMLVKGYSHLTGDNEVYILPVDRQVELWTIV